MVDIAEEANVSVATVSRVLSGARLSSVRPETAAAVRAAADRLGYRYNSVAAALRTQQTKMLGVIVPRIANPYFSILVESLERTLSPSDVELLIADSREDHELEAQRIAALVDRRVDGLIIVPAAGELSTEAISQTGIPTVQLDLRDAGPHIDRIGLDHAAGIGLIVDHLHEQGHRRIAFVGAEPAATPSSGRLQGYLAAVAEEERRDVLLDAFSMEWGYEAAGRLSQGADAATAVICANDLIAYGVLRWAHEQRVGIPSDLAVTGFDDLPLSAITAPPLTTIRQPVTQLAEATVELILSRIAGDADTARQVRLHGELVVRDSA